MNRRQKLITSFSAILVSVLMLAPLYKTITVQAKGGDDSTESSGSGSSGSGSSGSGSGSTSTTTTTTSSGSTSGTSSSSTKSGEVEKVEIEDEDEAEIELADDESQDRIEIRIENGKAVTVVKAKNKETKRQLASTDSVAIEKADKRGKKHRLRIRRHDNGFEIEEDGIRVRTNFPIEVDAEKDLFSVVTPAGRVTIHELPHEAIEALTTAKMLDKVDLVELEDENEAETPEKPEDVKAESENKLAANKHMVFRVSGTKHVKLLGLIDFDARIKSHVDASTGEPKLDDQPWFLNLLGFLFTK